MSERNYYVICDSGCKFPAMTAEQVLAAIAEATGKTAVNVPEAFITKIKEGNAGGYVTFWVGTTAQYNALDTHDPNCFYIKTDDTTIEDINKALVYMGKKVDDVVEAVDVKNASMLEKAKKTNDETIAEAERIIADATAIHTLTVTDFVGCTGNNNTDEPDLENLIEPCEGEIIFTRQGNLVTVEFDIIAQPYANGKRIYFFYEGSVDIPTLFRPLGEKHKVGLIQCDNSIVHDNYNHNAAAVYVNNKEMYLRMYESAASNTSNCHWIGTITYFV